VCEKETKTKTYSKEGLARAERLDPAEQAKVDTSNWIRDYVESMNGLVEEKEVEIERLSSGKGKKTNKAQIEDLNYSISQHKFHINKLDGIIRLVLNDRIPVDLVDPLQEDLDYYIESHSDDDYQQAYDEDFFYEALGLDELDVVNVDCVTQVASKEKPKEKADDVSATSTKGNRSKKEKKTSSNVIGLKIGRASKNAIAAAAAAAAALEEKTPSKKAPPVVPTPARAAPPTPPPPPPAHAAAGGASMAAILKREQQDQEKERQQKALAQQVCILLFVVSVIFMRFVNCHF
jgi:CCR4-NOT transcription complex subunit 3